MHWVTRSYTTAQSRAYALFKQRLALTLVVGIGYGIFDYLYFEGRDMDGLAHVLLRTLGVIGVLVLAVFAYHFIRALQRFWGGRIAPKLGDFSLMWASDKANPLPLAIRNNGTDDESCAVRLIGLHRIYWEKLRPFPAKGLIYAGAVPIAGLGKSHKASALPLIEVVGDKCEVHLYDDLPIELTERGQWVITFQIEHEGELSEPIRLAFTWKPNGIPGRLPEKEILKLA